MIGAEQRVPKPARKSSRNVTAAMGKRWRCTGRPQEQRYRDDRNFVVPRIMMGSAMGAELLEIPAYCSPGGATGSGLRPAR